MGRLTADMTRLVGEIHTARGERQRRGVEMKRMVARMRGGFRTAHAEMARRQRSALREFVLGLEGRVASLRNAFRTDIAGAHAAWFGTVAAAGPTGREHSKRAGKATGS